MRDTWKSDAALAVLFFLCTLPLLIWIPTLFPHAEGVVSAAQAEGYNNQVAHLIVASLAILCVAAVILLNRAAPHQAVVSPSVARSTVQPADLLQAALVAILIAALYFPPALIRQGPFLEENIHLQALHRMLDGDVPYRDFEFLYGPLMLYPAYYWARLTGYSLISFYTYVAALEVLVMLAVLLPIQVYLVDFRKRLGAFVLLSIFYLNPLIGPNQNGLRKVAGVLLLISVAARPFVPKLWVAYGVGLGALLSYSQDFGAATAMGIAAIYGTLFIKNRERQAIKALAVIVPISALTWIVIAGSLLGVDTSHYFASLQYLTQRFNAGEAAFRFYWTASSLALFGLLFLAAWHTGRLLSRSWSERPATGDLLFIGGFVYALVALKSGLNRADQWHLVPGILVLAFAVVLPLPARILALPPMARGWGIGFVFVLALTYFYGQYPITQTVVRNGFIEGYTELLSGQPKPTLPDVVPARPAFEFDRGNPSQYVLDLSVFLAAEPQRGRRLFVYGGPWTLPARVGATKAGPLGDDYIYGDDKGPAMRAYLDSHPETLVAIQKEEYEWLLQGPDAPVVLDRKFNLLGPPHRRFERAYLSSVHIPGAVVEERLKRARWRRLLGLYVVAHYRVIYNTGELWVLERIRSGKPAGAFESWQKDARPDSTIERYDKSRSYGRGIVKG